MPNIANKLKDYLWGSNEEYDDNIYADETVALRAGSAVSQPKVGAVHSMTTIAPRSFNDARSIGEAFRDGLTTVVNVSAMSDADARRIIDFASGLIFGLRGAIEQVDAKVFILTPEQVEVVVDGPATAPVATEFMNIG